MYVNVKIHSTTNPVFTRGITTPEVWEKKPAYAGFFASEERDFLKTRIYVDGYNLYYGCLRNTPYKWLDLKRLFTEQILPSSAPFDYSIATPLIKLYTAKIVEKAANSHDSVADQESYHRALRFTYSDGSLEIIEGYYSVVRVSAYLVDPVRPGKWPRECDRADIWKLEEKQSDVNLALDSVTDVLQDPNIGHVVFVTNDTDIAPALRKLKELTKVKIGLVIPTRNLERNENQELSKYADWVRSGITNDELHKSLLPRTVPGGKKSANRPISWFGQPELVQEILDVLIPAIPSLTKRWRWLDEKKPSPAGLPVLKDVPSNLLDDETTAQHVLLHAKAYVEYKRMGASNPLRG